MDSIILSPELTPSDRLILENLANDIQTRQSSPNAAVNGTGKTEGRRAIPLSKSKNGSANRGKPAFYSEVAGNEECLTSVSCRPQSRGIRAARRPQHSRRRHTHGAQRPDKPRFRAHGLFILGHERSEVSLTSYSLSIHTAALCVLGSERSTIQDRCGHGHSSHHVLHHIPPQCRVAVPPFLILPRSPPRALASMVYRSIYAPTTSTYTSAGCSCQAFLDAVL